MAHRLRRWLACALPGLLAAAVSYAAPFAYIRHDNGVAVIDVAAHLQVTNIPVSGVHVAALPGKSRAYVSSTPIQVIESRTQSVVLGIEAANTAYMALSPAESKAIIFESTCAGTAPCGTSTRVRLLDTDSRGDIGSFTQVGNFRAAAFNHAGTHVYIADLQNGIVHVRETRNFLALPSIAVPNPNALAVHPGLNRLYVAQLNERSVRVVNLDDNSTLATVPLPGNPADMVIDPSGGRLYVVTNSGRAAVAIDTSTNAVVLDLPLADVPVGVDITPDGGFLYVVRSNGSVSVFSTASLNLVAGIPIGPGSSARGRFIGGLSRSAPPALPGVLTGLFWNSGEPGWGIHLTQRGNTVFAAFFTYGTEGAPRWYTASSCTFVTEQPCPTCVEGAICHGGATESRGPYMLSDTFDPALVTRGTVGSFRMRFHDANAATLTYDVNGFARTVEIQRQLFGSGAAPGTNYSDLWWNPNESGWGLGVSQQGNLMFLTWFVYDRNREPVWYVASRCEVVATGNGCRGRLYRASGPIGPHSPNGFDTARVRIEDAGSIEADFSDGSNGVIRYILDGTPASKNITRQVF